MCTCSLKVLVSEVGFFRTWNASECSLSGRGKAATSSSVAYIFVPRDTNTFKDFIHCTAARARESQIFVLITRDLIFVAVV